MRERERGLLGVQKLRVDARIGLRTISIHHRSRNSKRRCWKSENRRGLFQGERERERERERGTKTVARLKRSRSRGLEKSSRWERNEVKLIDNKGGFDSIENFFHLAPGRPLVVVGGLPAGNQPILFTHPPVSTEHRRPVSVDR